MIRIGLPGWTFEGWRGSFYPKGLKQKLELEYASRQLNAIEINGTFYSLQKPESFQKWHDETPPGFEFSMKAPQFITHIKRLKDCEEPLANFFASGVLALGEKLGPILWQFPPSVVLKDDRFEKFIQQLPRDTTQALRLAENHSAKVRGRAFLEKLCDKPIRHVFELRHQSFRDPAFIKLLRDSNIAFCFGHAGGESSPYLEDVTADFVYLRLHGEGKEYKKGYPAKSIPDWAERVQAWAQGGEPEDAIRVLSEKAPARAERDVYLYFCNAEKKTSPANALQLMKKLGVKGASVEAA